MIIKGNRGDAASLFEIIKRRIKWMDENSIDQWNNHDYLSFFPLEYFYRKSDQGKLYINKKSGRVVSGAIADTEDARWNDGAKALYIHNFASDAAYPGAGKEVLLYLIEKAKDDGCSYIRLDCDEDNKRLNEYYDSEGFVSLDRFEDGAYRGVKRQKAI